VNPPSTSSPPRLYASYITSTTWARRFADRHGGTSCLFVDTHAKLWRTEDLEDMVLNSADCIWDTR